MKKDKMKLAGLLLAIACTSCAAGAVITGTTAVGNNVVVQAEETGEYTTYTVTKIGVAGTHAATAINIYSLAGDGLPKDKGNWIDVYSLETGSGAGVLLNDTALTGIKMPGDLYVPLGRMPEEGDVLTIDGALSNANTGVKLVFNNCKLYFQDGKWVDNYIDYAVYEIGRVSIGANTTAKALYLNRADGEKYAVTDGSWAEKLTFLAGSGVGITINGTQISMGDIKIPSNMYVGLGTTAVEGDVLVIEGTFYNKTLKVKYVVSKTTFVWNGSAWENEAYDIYTISKIAAPTDSNANAVQLVLTGDKEIPAGNWNRVYTLEEGSGTGLTLGEATLATQDIKQPGKFYIGLGATAAEGDVLTIDGTYTSKEMARKFVFDNCQIKWNGSAWEEVGEVLPEPEPEPEPEPDPEPEEPEVQYTVSEIGALAVHNNSTGATANTPKATQLYMKLAEGTAPAIPSDGNNGWNTSFVLESGDGWKVNGVSVTTGALLNTNAGFYVDLGQAGVQVGDVLTVSGTFSNETVAAKYVVAESKFIWTGTVWTKYDEPTVYEIGKVAIDGGSSATAVNLKKANGEAFEVTDGTWAEKLYFISGTGAGVTLNGTALKVNDCKIPNNMYLALEGNTAKEGDVLVIGGAFFNGNLKVKYVIEETTFVFDGTAWAAKAEEEPTPDPDVPETEYTEVNIGRLLLKSSSSNAESAHTQRIYMKTDGNSNFVAVEGVDEYEVTYVSGTHVLLNGEACAYNRCRVSANGAQFYLKITVGGEEVGATVGDKVTFGGIFVSEEHKIKYTIEDSDFWWNGTAWQTEEYVDSEEPTPDPEPEEPEVQYTVYELGEMIPHANSVSLNNPRATQLYMKKADGTKLPIEDSTWVAKFALESGDGWKLNDKSVTVGNLVSSNAGLFVDISAAGVQVGDVLTVSGTFTYEAGAAKYVISESKFTWNGAAWEKYVYVEYTTHEVGSLIFMSWTAGNNYIYLGRADGKAFPIPDDGNNGWNAVFTCKSGVGVTLNGTPVKEGGMKFPNSLFINIYTAPNEGDILTVGGTFFNSACAIEYVVTETSFKWDGTTWVLQASETPEEPQGPDFTDYASYTVTKIAGYVAGADGATDVLQLYSLAGDELPKDQGEWDSVYTYAPGASVKLGDTAITATIKMPGDLYVPLGIAAAEGDVFTINGTFYNEAKKIKLVFNNCQMKLTNGKWVSVEGTVTPDPEEPEQPETPVEGTYDLGTLTVQAHSSGATSNVPKATQLYMKSLTLAKLPFTTWNDAFVLESGDGWKLNGEAFTPDQLISADGNLFANLASANVQVGDVITVSGTFAHTTANAKYIIKESKFTWNGTVWENYVDYETQDLGAVKFHDWTVGSNHIYLKTSEAFTTPPDKNNGWTAEFKWKDGVGVTVNDVTCGVVKFPNSMFIALPFAPEVGDILKVGGTFYNESLVWAYTVEESTFMWDGKTWAPVLDYTDYEVGGLTLAGTQNSTSYVDLQQAEGGNFAADGAYKFLGGSGAGIALNGELIETTTVTISGNKFMVSLTPAADEGAVLTIGGKFYNVEAMTQYIVEESSFIYENGVWVVYESNYNEIGLGELKVITDASNEQILYLESKDESVELVDMEGELTCIYGMGLTLNGEAVDGAVMYSIDNSICIELPTMVQDGDVLVIGGKFVSDMDGVLYFVKESKFTWSDTEEAWEGVINYKTVELGKLMLFGNSNTTDLGKADTLHFKAAGKIELNDFYLTLESGIGFTVNGEAREFTIKNLKDGAGYLYFKFGAVENGDIVKIGGTFYNKEFAVKYVIEESTFVWNDSWSVKCEQVNVGPLTMVTRDTTARDLYLIPSDISVLLPVADWEQGTFRLISGKGITVNGVQVDLTNNWKSVGGNTMFVRLTNATDGVENGSIVVIEGLFRSDRYGYEYIFEESSFIYENGSWRNVLDTIKAEKAAALDEYIATFVEADYYESEWALLQSIVADAKVAIAEEISKAKVEALFDNAKAAIDEVATKAEVDANFPQWKEDAKAELESYKDASLYREAEQATIASTIAQAKASIDACTNWADFNLIVTGAKAAMDALWTDAQWTAAEEVVTAAKDTLAGYKAEENYFEAEWAQMQAIIAQAYADIDANIGNTDAIATIVADAQVKMDAVKTSIQVEEEEMAILAAKAELEGYKTESDYNAAEWEVIQGILAKAYAQLDAAMGDSEAIANIMATAKADMDKILKSEEANAKAFADAKDAALEEVQAYAAALDYNLYSDEAMATISDYIDAAMTAIEEVSGIEEIGLFETIVAEMKANIEAVEKLPVEDAPAGDEDSDSSTEPGTLDKIKGAFGCNSVVGLASGVTLMAAAAAVVLGKKKED